MKNNLNPKSNQSASNSSGFRAAGVRANTAKTLEHRYERRKIREQLRRLDWALNVED
jgi:hypothetical protein